MRFHKRALTTEVPVRLLKEPYAVVTFHSFHRRNAQIACSIG